MMNQSPRSAAQVIVMMGVSGCGKSTLGRRLAKKIDARFIDGDDYHPQANIDKISNGIPLTDADREEYELEDDVHFHFVSKIVGGSIPREYIPAVKNGVQDAMESGVIAGYPLVDVLVELVDGSYHDVDSSEVAFKITGSMAFKEGARRAGVQLLEPVMDVEVVTPDDYMGDVMGDLSGRRGQIEGMEQRGQAQVIKARVPLSTMFGYATDVRSMSQGRASYSMQFGAYEPAPSNVQEEIVAKVRGE